MQKLGKIINNHVGLIELAEDLDIETVTEIFIRVNSAGKNRDRHYFIVVTRGVRGHDRACYGLPKPLYPATRIM